MKLGAVLDRGRLEPSLQDRLALKSEALTASTACPAASRRMTVMANAHDLRCMMMMCWDGRAF